MRRAFQTPRTSEFFAAPSQSPSSPSSSGNDGTAVYVKSYPSHWKRADVHGDFVHVKRLVEMHVPRAHLFSESVDSAALAVVAFRVPSSLEEAVLEKLMATKGWHRQQKTTKNTTT